MIPCVRRESGKAGAVHRLRVNAQEVRVHCDVVDDPTLRCFEQHMRDWSAALDDVGDRAILAEQDVMTGSLNLGRTMFRSG
jgi:hypothetical protein